MSEIRDEVTKLLLAAQTALADSFMAAEPGRITAARHSLAILRIMDGLGENYVLAGQNVDLRKIVERTRKTREQLKAVNAAFSTLETENRELIADIDRLAITPAMVEALGEAAAMLRLPPEHPAAWDSYADRLDEIRDGRDVVEPRGGLQPTVTAMQRQISELKAELDNAESRVAGQTCRAEAAEEENQKLRGELQTANGRVSKYIDRAAERATDNGHLKSALDQAIDTIHGFARKEREASELGAARYFVWESGAVSVFPAKNTGGVYFPRHIHYVDEWRIDSNDVARCEKYAEETDRAGAEKALEGHPKSLAELHRLAGTEPETPEPAELGELLDAHRTVVTRYNTAYRALGVRDGDTIDAKDCDVRCAEDDIETARKAIVDFVARQPYDRAAEWTASEKAMMLEYSKLSKWMFKNHKGSFRAIQAGDTYADIAIRLLEKSGDNASKAAKYDDLVAKNVRLANRHGMLKREHSALQAENEKLKTDLAVEHIEEPERKRDIIDGSPPFPKLIGPGMYYCGSFDTPQQLHDPICPTRAADVTVGKGTCGDCPDIRRRPEDPGPGNFCGGVTIMDEPGHKPSDTWCKLHDRATTLSTLPCDERRHRERLPRQKTNSHPGWGKGVICRCEHCPEFRTEPEGEEFAREFDEEWQAFHKPAADEAAVEAGMRAMGFEEEPESDRAMSPEMTKVFEPVERLRGLADHGANCHQLAKAIIDLEGNQRPPAEPLGTCLQAAITALPVTLRADATDMAEVLAAAGEAVLAIRLLVSVRAEVIDPTATCGECKHFESLALVGSTDAARECRLGISAPHRASRYVFRDCIACMKIERKPETSEETEPASKMAPVIVTKRIAARPDCPWLHERRSNDDITVAFPMSQHGQVSPAEVLLEGVVYVRGGTRTIPLALASDVCCCREYVKKPETKPAGKARFFLWKWGTGVNRRRSMHIFIGGACLYLPGSRSSSQISTGDLEGIANDLNTEEITEAVARARLADWPKGLAKLEELIGGEKTDE